MNILIIDKLPISLAFALECQEAGHRVKFYTSPKAKDDRVGEGLVPRVRDWTVHMSWADLVFMSDNSYMLEEFTEFFKKGFPIFGCCPEASSWELDRAKGQGIFQRAGLAQMHSETFQSYDEAIRHVCAKPGRYVSKPNGDLAKELSYVSKSASDMVYMLQRWKRTGRVQKEFILQDFQAGVEMGVGGWFGPDGWSKALCENWEFKKLGNGDTGPATGEMGTILRYVEESKLADEVLFPLTNFLHAIGYVGYCDVNCIINDKGVPYPLEFTNRPGWPLFNIQGALHKGDPCEWMLDKLEGRDTLRVKGDVAAGVLLALPPFPYDTHKGSDLEGIPIYGITEKNSRHISLSSVMAGKAPEVSEGGCVEVEMPVSAGTYLCVCHQLGDTVTEAREAVYNVVKSLEIPNSVIYRTDIGERLEGQLDKLHKLGYATGLEYC